MPSQSPGDYPGISAEEADAIYDSLPPAVDTARRLALPEDSYQAHCWLTVMEALREVEACAATEPVPEVARWVGLLKRSLGVALHLVMLSRQAEPSSVEDFAWWAARLEGLWPLVEAESKGLDTTGWPNNPDAAVARFAGWCMLEAAVRFTAAIFESVVDAGFKRSRGARPSDDLALSDVWWVEFRKRVATDLDKRLLPRSDWWSKRGDIVLAREQAVNKLEAEYRAWAEAQREAAASPALKAAAGGRTWQKVMTLAEQAVRDAGGVWPERGITGLAEQLKASRKTVRKAVDASAYLRAREAEHKAKAGGGGRVDGVAKAKLDAGELAQSREADPAETLDSLIEEQRQDDEREKRGRA